MKLTNDRAKDASYLLVLLIYVAFLISHGLYYLSIQFVDFPTFYYAASAAFVENRSPYQALVSPQVQASTEQTIFPFLYPPPSLLAFYPLSMFSYETAAKLILILNHFLIAVFIYLFLHKVYPSERGRPFWTLALAYTFMFHPMAVTLNRGQVNLLVLVSVCLTWYTYKRNRHPSIIALPLSVAAIVKTYPAIFLFYLVVKKKYQTALWFLGYLGFFSSVAYLLLPDGVWSDWIIQVLPTGGYGRTPLNLFSPAAPWNQSINGFTSRLFLANQFSQPMFPNPIAARIVPYVLSAPIVLFTFAIIAKASNVSESGSMIDLEFSLLLAAMYLAAPFSWEHHLVLVLPAAIIALKLVLSTPRRNALHAIVLFSTLLLAWRFPHWAEVLKQGALTLGISAKFYAVICIWIFYVLVICKHTNNFNRSSQSAQQDNMHGLKPSP